MSGLRRENWDGSLNHVPHRWALATVVDDFGNLLRMRRCGHCRRWLECDVENFSPRGRTPSGYVSRWDGWCRPCRRENRRRYYANTPALQRKVQRRAKEQRMRADQGWLERRRAVNREYMRKRRVEAPEKLAEQRARYIEKLRQDPKRYEEFLAARRMEYHLRQERKGRKKIDGGHATGGPELPIGPLLAVVERYLQRVDHWNGDDDAEIVALERIGLDPRSLYGWRKGERKAVRFDVVDRVLVRLDLNWFDVYEKPVNGHAEDPEAWKAYRAACLAFEGELVE